MNYSSTLKFDKNIEKKDFDSIVKEAPARLRDVDTGKLACNARFEGNTVEIYGDYADSGDYHSQTHNYFKESFIRKGYKL